jgi:uncharacterized protein YneF (UPF0154 family)
MGFKLQKRRYWLFLPVVVLELGMAYILNYFNIHPLWIGLILILIAVFLAALILWGKAIFHRRFYLTYRDIESEIHEITPTEEQLTQIMHLASFLCHFAMIQILHALSGIKIYYTEAEL